MKNSKLIKMFLVMVVSICVAFVATNVFAADDGFVDLTNTIGGNTTTDNNTTLDENVDIANNTTNNTTNTNLSLNSITTTNNTTNTSSSYNTNTNTNLPATGIDGTGTTIALIVVLTISGVYAYKKVVDYKNI